jgi:predicted DNA-binding transcriptional regulator YafY
MGGGYPLLRTNSVLDYPRRVLTTSARVLRLLSLLQARGEWSGGDLAERLEIDVRTLRRDVDRLRTLGYVIDASSGPGGGYRLGAGSSPPPLLLDDDEAVAVAVALAAAAGSVAKLRDIALGVLVKLERILPPRLRRRVDALHAVTLTLSGGAPSVEPAMLMTIASACRDHESLRFQYRDQANRTTLREVEPMRLVHTGRLWYLAAWDVSREGWRTFRLDRVDVQGLFLGARFIPREPPEDLATYVSRSITTARYQHRVRVRLSESSSTLAERIPPWIGLIEPIDERTSMLTIGGDTIEALTSFIVQTGVDFELLEPPELKGPIREIAERLLRGTSGPEGLS